MDQISFAQKGVIFNESKTKILVGKYLDAKYVSEKLKGKLCLPGGKLEFGETPDESFIREIQEETGVTIKPGELLNTWTWIYEKETGKKQIVAVGRIGYYLSGEISEPTGDIESTLDKFKWIDINEINIEEFVEDERKSLEMGIKQGRV